MTTENVAVVVTDLLVAPARSSRMTEHTAAPAS
jgi:hypothetical protein